MNITEEKLNKGIEEIKERGLVYQQTDDVRKSEITFYMGVDLTAESLHIGHLVPLKIVDILSKHGNKPIILLGEGTTMIGDPSMRNNERPMLEKSSIKRNMEFIKNQIKKISPNAIYVNNLDWISKTNFIDFLRDVASKFSVNQMVNLETFKNRLNNNLPLSFLEFSYPLLQSFDFLELYKKYDCELQIGGSDQWGNIINGVNLLKKSGAKSAYGITTPLLLRGGKKMGKTTSNPIWLDKNLTSCFDFWQFWRSIPDSDVESYMLKFTDLKKDQILEKIRNNINEAKKHLADCVTCWVHGKEISEEVRNKAEKIFEQGSEDAYLDLVCDFDGNNVSENGELLLYNLLFKKGLAKSLSDAKRKISDKSVKINGKVEMDYKYEINPEQDSILEIGKKLKFKLKFN
ncbi:tyrosine--tRNA ligase [Candidatus Nesciobacter abundans]|uniref:Tyrosine--tRNA ligase n=1 Tax=Candidatus Nesciobacter abundans TaxID=2601668 RepID=A0A5C0UFY3_9PROT|nr:tyrosine--tRNA ligase [Candidatus Nesciobacter abundans]QEK39005.1 tyrosine--tRNA ligase [Candidatus Nesciobacter abundans]